MTPLEANPETAQEEWADSEGGGTRARPLVPASSVTDRAGRYFTLSDTRPMFIDTIDEDAVRIGDGWVIAPADRLTDAPPRVVQRSIGWFSAFARRHGHHAQADWLDGFVRDGGLNAVGIAAGDAPNPSRPTPEDVEAALRHRLYAKDGRVIGFAEAADDIISILDLLPTGEGWRPIETAPKDGDIVWLSDGATLRIGFWRDGAEFECHGSKDGGWRDFNLGRDLSFSPAFWMPTPTLPPAPSIAGEGR